MSQTDADVVIVGGGMVGGVLAWALADSGLQVAMVEQGELENAADLARERSIALSWGSRQLLEAVGLWADLEQYAAPIRRIHVSQQGHLGTVRIRAEQHKIDALGYVIRNACVLRSLTQRLPKQANLRIFSPAQVVALSQSNGSAELTLDNGQLLKAQLLVVADGSDSATALLAGMEAEVDDYEQQAVVATLSAVGTPEGMAWERFTSDGPMALLPLGQGLLSLVYTVPSDRRDEVLALDDEAFIGQVQAAIGQRVGRIVSTSPRQVFPLRRLSVSPSWQGRVVLVGNAARTLHPVSGQGFNLGLRDAMALAEQLQGLAIGQDAGADFIREQYLGRRQADQRETIALTDILARTFRGRSRVLGHMRGAGLLATDRLPLLRQRFARRSMGLAHRTPKVDAPA